jgi:hypothetical protein
MTTVEIIDGGVVIRLDPALSGQSEWMSPAAALALAERLKSVATSLLPCRECGGEGTVLRGTGYGKCGPGPEVPCPRCKGGPPVTPEQYAEFLHATYDGDERGLWEDSHP